MQKHKPLFLKMSHIISISFSSELICFFFSSVVQCLSLSLFYCQIIGISFRPISGYDTISSEVFSYVHSSHSTSSQGSVLTTISTSEDLYQESIPLTKKRTTRNPQSLAQLSSLLLEKTASFQRRSRIHSQHESSAMRKGR